MPLVASRQTAESGAGRKLVVVAVLALVALSVFVAWPPPRDATADSSLDDRASIDEPKAVDPKLADAVRADGGDESAEANTPDGSTPDDDAGREQVETGDPRLVHMRGSVVDVEGQPIEGASVRVSITLFPITRRSYDAVTDARGEFRIENMIAGRAAIGMKCDGYCEATLRARDVAAGERVELDPVTLHLGTEIDGEVRIDGKTAPGVQIFVVGRRDRRVQVSAATAVARKDGKFTLNHRLPPGHYRVLAMPALQFGPFSRARQRKVVVGEFDLVSGQAKHTVYVDIKGRD